jgi:phytoene synthase
MAWWRERLEELDSGTVPAEPRLRAVERQLLGRGISGSELSKLEDAWLPLLEPFPWGEQVAEGLRLRGGILFGIGARLLGGDLQDVADCEPAGSFWSLVDGARHCSDDQSRQFLLDEARKSTADLPQQKPRPAMRRMTVLAALAAHDVVRGKPLDAGGGLARVAVASAHLLRGSMPRAS